jgi:hypothetical protein
VVRSQTLCGSQQTRHCIRFKNLLLQRGYIGQHTRPHPLQGLIPRGAPLTPAHIMHMLHTSSTLTHIRKLFHLLGVSFSFLSSSFTHTSQICPTMSLMELRGSQQLHQPHSVDNIQLGWHLTCRVPASCSAFPRHAATHPQQRLRHGAPGYAPHAWCTWRQTVCRDNALP